MTDLSISMNDGDTLNFNDFFDYSKSKVTATAALAMGRADMWVFPFLDIMVIAGAGNSSIYAPLKIDEEIRQKLEEWGWLIGIDSTQVPDEIVIRTDINSTMIGAGATLAWGYKDFHIAVSGMFLQTKLIEANTSSQVWMISPLIGYRTPWFNILAGAQAQFYSTRVQGSFRLDADKTLNYNVDFIAQKWNFIAGVYKDMWKHFVFSAQFGFGSRQSMTVIVGYRI